MLKRRLMPVLLWLLMMAAPVARAADAADIRRDSTVAAVEAAMPSVVNISAKTIVRQQGYFYNWWRDNWAPFYEELPPQTSAGSGVIIDEEGYVLTNVHVVEDADEITVKLHDGRVLPAEVLAGLKSSDVALLKIKGPAGEKFKPVKLAGDDDLLLGETVIALGNPFGLGGSVSRGILSSKTRRATDQGEMDFEDWLQTDAAINPGNSGGPLVNLKAELIGLNVAIYRSGQGIGFAIPVKRVSQALSEIFTPEALKSLWFGARLQATTNMVVVRSVEQGSPAEKAGLRKGDIVTAVNRKPVKSVIGVNRELISSARQPVRLNVARSGQPQEVTVQMVPETTFFNAALVQQRLGCAVQDLTPDIATRLRLSSLDGIIITSVEPGSPAEKAGLRRGFVVFGIDDARVSDVTVAARLLHARKKGDVVRLSVMTLRPARRAIADVRIR
jgi:serine protease Do